MLREAEADWVGGARVLSGAANWITSGSEVPGELAGSVTGADPGLDGELRPVAGSPLVDVGYAPPLVPAFEPPLAGLAAAGAARPADEALDIGAYEMPDVRFRLVRVRRAGLGFVAVVRVSRRARVGGVVLRHGKRVRRVRRRTLAPGRRALRIGRLRPGRYRLRLDARAGSRRAHASLRFRVRGGRDHP